MLLGTAALSHPFAAQAESFTADRVAVASNKSFDQVRDAIKSLVAKNGMMVMAEVDQGGMLSMAGLSLKATLYLVGNPTAGKRLFEQTHGVGLYVPLRVFVYTDPGRLRQTFDAARPVPQRIDFDHRRHDGPEARGPGDDGRAAAQPWTGVSRHTVAPCFLARSSEMN